MKERFLKLFDKYPVVMGIIILVLIILIIVWFRKMYKNWVEKKNREALEEEKAKYGLASFDVETVVRTIHSAMYGWEFWTLSSWTDDSTKIITALSGRTPKEIDLIKKAYEMLYSKSLKQDIEENFSGEPEMITMLSLLN